MIPLPDEAARQQLLTELSKLDNLPQPPLDSLVRLLASHLACPIAWLGLLNPPRLLIKAQVGLDRSELPLPAPALLSALLAPEGCALGDTDWLHDLGAIRAFASARIVVDGQVVGMVCAMDVAAHAFEASHRAALHDVAQMAGTLLESGLKEQRWRTLSETNRVRKAERLLSDALDGLTAGVMISDAAGRVALANPIWRERIGHYMNGDATWPEIVERMVDAGAYPGVTDRQAFVRWRLGLASERAEHHELRWNDRWVIVSDRLLADGGVLHLSIDITDRKLAELALAEQQAQLRESQGQLIAVLGAVPDLWFVLDADGRYLSCSSEKHPMLLHSWESVRGKPFEAGVPKPLADRVVAAVARALASAEVQRIDYDLTTADGVSRSFEARISPMPNQQVLYVTRDLTELRNLERDVLIMQRALEAEASLPISVVDATLPDMPLIYVNPAFERLTGYGRNEVLGRNCRFMQGPMTDQPGRASLRDALRAGQSASVTLSNMRKDGTVFSNALHVEPVRDAAGHLTHYIGVQRDVTEQSRAADKLRLSEELYRSVASAISDGLLVVTPALTIIAVNPAACSILGVEQAAVVNMGDAWPFELLGADEQPLAPERNPIKRVVQSDQPLINQLHALRRPDGQRRWVALNAHPLQLRPEGNTFSVVLTFRDITQQRAADQMQRDKQAAELASQAKSEFLSRMSHEMRTPLNAVIGFSQLLGLNQNTLDAKTVREYAGHVLDAGEHLLALIDDVLDLQKIEDGVMALSLGPVDLHEVVTRSIELLSPTAQARLVHFDNQVSPGVWVRADMQRLRQVLLNVASNAIKYNHPGGKVCWRVESVTEGRLTLCVEDNGAGMSAEQMSRLFQPFERLGRETSAIEGTGLGLIIARSLAQAIGGRLNVASVAGQGTCVRIELQCDEAPAGAARLPAPPAAITNAGLRMLYVEDNRINALLFEEAMRMHSSHIELRVAEDGEEALALAQDWQPEVLVLDANLPGISGFEVLRQLRTLPGLDNVPAYMCSADAMPDDVQRAYEAGFIGYWAKPINIGAVLADIEACMRRGR
jgi:PAS domain S-box-containing protein